MSEAPFAEPYIELEHVYRYFPLKGGKVLEACHDLNLRISRGDMVAVVGETGSGKSTLGKMILGVLQPSRGRIVLAGQEISHPHFKWNKALRSSVQVVHQDSFSSLNPVRTVYQTLSAPLFYHKPAGTKKEAIEKLTQLLEAMELRPAEVFLHKYPFQLSGGQRQRVSIARATILNPEVIVADEPVSAVDASSRLSIIDLMKNLNQAHQITFIYITHDLATARYFAPRGKLAVMQRGRIVEEGIIEDCFSHPAHPYLRALLRAILPSDPFKANIFPKRNRK